MDSVLNKFCLEDCYEILKKKNVDTRNFTVNKYEFYPFNQKLGFLGNHSYLKINYTCNGITKEHTFFTKSMCTSESLKAFAIDTGAFHKECQMFQEIIPEFLQNDINIITECVPSCYLVADMHYLIFEDLGCQGYKLVNSREPMNLDCIKVALQTLAKFHCSTLILEENINRKNTEEIYNILKKFPKLFQESFYSNVEISLEFIEAAKKGAQAEIDLFEDGTEIEQFKKLTCKAFDQFREIVLPSSEFRNTICHGDLWCTNMMFKFEDDNPTHCCFVDFQSYRYSPPAQDFLAFIYLTTDRKFRQKYLEDMKTYYYEQMNQTLNLYSLNIEEILPYTEFIKSCSYYKLFAITQAINHHNMIMIPPDETVRLFEVPGVMREVMFVDKSKMVLELCAKYESYRNKIHETIVDLKEFFVENNLLNA